MNKITNFTQIKEIIEPIPANKFCRYKYEKNGKCCFLGHIHAHFSTKINTPIKFFGITIKNKKSPINYTGDFNGFGARQLTARFLKEKHGIFGVDGTEVNNEAGWCCYNEPQIKKRLMHMINDAIAAGY